MAWTCSACEFAANEDTHDACVACGSERQEEQQQEAAATANGDAGDDNEVVVIELPAKEKLGVKLTPPKNGVIEHGLAIDNINNPLLDGKVQAGDLIVAIGGQNVDGMGFSEAIDLIRKLPRPLPIAFEIDKVRREEVVREKFKRTKENDLDKELTTYAVVFDDGPMGLNLEEAVRYGIDGAVVRALKGQAKTSGMISIGDIVYKVNEVDVLCMPYTEVMTVLRNATIPKTLQFVPKDKLADVQRVNSRHSESFRIRESTSAVKQKLMQNPRLVKDIDNSESEDSRSIAQLIMENQAATIKKGRMYKQGRVMRSWKSRYFVLSVSKMEYFKNPSSTTSRGDMSFLNHRCTVRSLPGSTDVVCRSPNVTAEFILELRVDDRRMVMACTSESDKKGWMDAIKLAIDASKTVNRTQNPSESLREAKALRTQRTESLSIEGSQTFLDRNAGGRLSQFNYDAFATPVVHVAVISATNLAKTAVNALCEVTVGAETFKTSIVKNQRSPVWKQDNSASFEAPSEEMVVEIRVFNEHVFRASELIATLTIPLRSLPNLTKTTKKYPLAVGSRSAGAVLTLSLEYVNKAKAYHEDQERGRFDSMGGIMNERDEMVKIKAEAQMAADEASHHAARAEEEARMLLEQARKKAEAAMAAAREEQAQGKAAVEAAMAEAARAKEEAEKQAAEARRAQAEAQQLIEANRRIQETSSQAEGPSVFAPYRQMVMDGMPIDDVKAKMREDGVDDTSINAFFDGINSYDEKIRALQAEVEKLKRSRSTRVREEPRPQDMLANLDISSDQVKLLRRLLKLEKQLQQAGIAVAADIPYEEAKAKVEEISRRMGEIGSADVTHPDLAIQKQLREEYYRLEQDMEKYNTALMLTDEYAAEEARKEREWEEENYEDNVKALKAVRRMMPVDIKKMSEAELAATKTPNGQMFSRDIARKFKRTNVLELLRMNPLDIAKNHPSLLENLRVTGLTVTERRALHMHLKDIAETWKAQQGEEMTKKKFEWFKSLKETFKTVVNSYNKHVKQYGPEDNHPYATRDDPDIGCPMIGKQCPIKANRSPAYDIDYGYTIADEYMESTVQKGNVDDAGARALAEAQELARSKLANARADALKKHYKNVRLVAEANGVCEHIDTTLDRVEGQQLHWFQDRLKHRLNRTETAATIKVELAEFGELVNEIRLATLKFAERSGMNLSGKRNPATDQPDTRSSIECNLILLYCDGVNDCFDGMEERMDEVKASDKRLRSAIPTMRELLKDLQGKSRETLGKLKDKGPPMTRRVKTRAEILKEAKEKNASEGGGPAAAAEEAAPERAPNPMMAARGRGGRGRGPGRGDLFSQIAAARGRGGRGGDEEGGGGGGGGGDFLSAIRGRGRGGPARGGMDLMASIKARGAGRGGGDEGGGGRGGMDLMASIKARGRGPAAGRGDFLSAIASRKKD